MDLVSFTQQQAEKKVSLLSLPRSYMSADSSHSTKTTNDNQNQHKSNQENEAPAATPKHAGQLVLMQLPKGIQISDLISASGGGCHFLAPKVGGANDNNNSSSNMRQAALVVESKHQSFSISRLETSNALVLVPPLEDTTTDINGNNNNNGNRTDEGPASKKPKVGGPPSRSLRPVPARLLTPGGSGSSFLELRPKMLRPGALATLLEKHVFDPYNHTKNPYNNNNKTAANTNLIVGRTVPSLARELQSSQGQVVEALAVLQSFSMPSPSSYSDTTSPATYYGVLSEEALQEAHNAIIATLAESDDFGDYAGQGVDVDDFVAQVVERFSRDQAYPQLEHVIRYALRLLLVTQTPKQADSVALTGTLPLDVQKVGGFEFLPILYFGFVSPVLSRF